jgi:hypothetical protein
VLRLSDSKNRSSKGFVAVRLELLRTVGARIPVLRLSDSKNRSSKGFVAVRLEIGSKKNTIFFDRPFIRTINTHTHIGARDTTASLTTHTHTFTHTHTHTTVSPALGGLQISGLSPANLEFWVRFPIEMNQGKQAHAVCK